MRRRRGSAIKILAGGTIFKSMEDLPLADVFSGSLELASWLTTDDSTSGLSSAPWFLLEPEGRRLAVGFPLFLLPLAKSIGMATLSMAALLALGKLVSGLAKVPGPMVQSREGRGGYS